MEHQVSVSCSSDKEEANVICEINTEDGIFAWITAEFHHIC